MTTPSPASLDAAFPCRFAIDASLRLVSCGPGLAALAPAAAAGANLADVFRVVEPGGPAGFDALCARSGMEVVLETIAGGVALSGVLIHEPERETVHVLARPAPGAAERDRASKILLRELAQLPDEDRTGLLRRILRADADALEIERVSYWSLREEGAAILCEGLCLRSQGQFEKGIQLMAADYPRYFAALAARKVIDAGDAHRDPRTSEFSRDYLTPAGIGAMLDVPVFVGGQLVGVVCHEHVGGTREFSAYEQQIALAVAQSIAQVLEADARRRAEDAVRENSIRFRKIVEISPVAILVTTLGDGKILYANDACAALMRLPAEELVHHLSTDFYYDPAHRAAIIAKFRRDGFLREEELRLVRPDGTVFWSMLSVAPVHFDGTEALLCGIVDLSEHKRAQAELEQVLRALERDLERARAFQESMKPPAIGRTDVQLEVAFQPADQVSGDVYDYEVLDGNLLRLFVADATGHGISASLTTMFLRSEYDVASQTERSPSAVLRALNARLARFLSRFAMRFTAVCATLDLATGELRWSSGGHPPPCVVRDGTLFELDSGGPFLGLLPDLAFPEWTRVLLPGDTLCLLSDGLTEALDSRGKPIGEQQVYEWIEEATRAGAPLGAAVVGAVREAVGMLQDDATLLAARWLPAAR